MKTSFETVNFDMKVEEIMSKNVISVKPETTVDSCAKLMVNNKIGSVVVIDEKDHLVGIITKENIIKHVIAQDKQAKEVNASTIMSFPVVTAKTNDTIIDVMYKMFKENIRHLIIIDSSSKKLAGICTDTDIFRVLPTLVILEQEYRKLFSESEIKNDKPEFFSGYCDDCGEYSDSLIFIDGQYKCPMCVPEDVKMSENEPEL